MHDAKLSPEEILAKVRDLPPLPEVVNELIRFMNDDGASGDYLASKLAEDPALSAKALRLANSSFYGLSRQILSIPEALTVLGRRTVGLMVLAAAATDAMQVRKDIGFDTKAFWRHALGAALSSQALAKCLHMNPDVGFTVGLLHDIGQIALACIVPDRYAEVIAYRHKKDCLTIQAEWAVLGTDHAIVGGGLAEYWLFAPAIVEAITHHHAPSMHHGPGLVGLAHMGDAIAHALGLSGDANEAVPPTPPDIWAALSPDTESCMKLFADVEDQFDDVCAALQV
jgi:HD-like signal output (HDOD) protein